MATTMSREMAALCTQLVQWRKDGGGGRGKRIPEAVWKQAAAVARVDGVHATARATRLNYERLKASVAATEVPRTDGELVAGFNLKSSRRSGSASEALAQNEKPLRPKGPSAFVSVQIPPLAPRHVLTIELTSRSGERMRIESSDALDLGEVVQSFLRRS